MAAFVAGARRAGVTHFAFGDLFLEDIRRYRERQFAGSGVELLFPLWRLPTVEWAGGIFDPAFVAAMRPGIDPCGENGEFHTAMRRGGMACVDLLPE
jgi:diphthamide synthase (EF-2-diphthine--ammonia ligase)